MLEMYIEGIGLAAPGLPSWEAACAVLQGKAPYQAEPLDRYKPELLPANERRRATDMTRLAFRVSEEATRNSAEILPQLAAVFASSGGDYQIIDQICRALSLPERLVSPTQFHNSVHNSAAGYWSIATQSQAPSTSLSAFDDAFPAGLIEAATLVQLEQQPTLLTVYDAQPPLPLREKRPIALPFGCALLLKPQSSHRSLAKLSVTLTQQAAHDTQCTQADLEPLRIGNPAARTMPLFELLAQRLAGQISVTTHNGQSLMLDISPCHPA